MQLTNAATRAPLPSEAAGATLPSNQKGAAPLGDAIQLYSPWQRPAGLVLLRFRRTPVGRTTVAGGKVLMGSLQQRQNRGRTTVGAAVLALVISTMGCH